MPMGRLGQERNRRSALPHLRTVPAHSHMLRRPHGERTYLLGAADLVRAHARMRGGIPVWRIRRSHERGPTRILAAEVRRYPRAFPADSLPSVWTCRPKVSTTLGRYCAGG